MFAVARCRYKRRQQLQLILIGEVDVLQRLAINVNIRRSNIVAQEEGVCKVGGTRIDLHLGDVAFFSVLSIYYIQAFFTI